MKKLFWLLAIILMASCNSSKNDELLKYTTDKTLAVGRLDLEALSGKVPVDKILKEKKDLKPEDKLVLQWIKNPKQAGIDVSKPMFIIMDPGKSNDRMETRILFWLDDMAKFQTEMSKMENANITIDKKNLIYKDKKIIGSVNDKLAMIRAEEGSKYDYETGAFQSTTFTEKDMNEFWNRKSSTNSTIKEQVNKALVKGKDIGGWVNVQAVASFLSKGYIETLSVNKLLTGAGIGYDVNFDKGKIDWNGTTFFNKEMSAIVKKYYDKNAVNYDMVKNIDLDKANSYSVGYFSLEFLRYIIREAGFEATINTYLANYGKTLEDITKTFTGDYAIVDFPRRKVYSMDYYQQNTAAVFGYNKNQKNALVNFLNQLMTSGGKYMMTDTHIIFSDDNAILSQFKNQQAAKNSTLNKKSGVTSYSYAKGAAFDSEYDSTSKTSSWIKNLESEAKENSGNITATGRVSLVHDNENALYYLIMANDQH